MKNTLTYQAEVSRPRRAHTVNLRNKIAPGPGKNPSPAPSSSLLLHAWIFIPAFLFFRMVIEHVQNLPHMDDYDAILDFLNRFRGAGFMEKLALLFKQHNEHRLLHSRIIYALYYLLTGTVNFKAITLIGDLQLVGVYLISVHFIRKCISGYWSIPALVWGILLFDLNTYEAGSWAMGSMQVYGIVLLFFLSLYFYSRDGKWALVSGALFQVLCIFSSGNGMLAAVCLTAFTWTGKDKWRKLISSLIPLVFVPLYFAGYKFGPPAPDNHFGVSGAITFFIRQCGANFDFNDSFIWGSLFLLGTIVLSVRLIRSKILAEPELRPILTIAGFLLVTMGLVAYMRSGLPGAQFQTSRYLLYPQLLIAVVFLFLFRYLQGKKVQWPVSIVCLAIFLYCYSCNYRFGEYGFIRTEAHAALEDFWYPAGGKANAQRISKEACEAGIYCLEEER